MPTPTPDPWVTLVLGVLSTGSLKYVYDAWRAWRSESPRELKVIGVVDANIATVARARDELIEDNSRLRETLTEERAQHAVDRARWLADQERLRADVARLEAQIRQERSDANERLQAEQARANERYDSLLDQVNRLGARTEEMKDRRDG